MYSSNTFNNNKNVVVGEASETDSEDDSISSAAKIKYAVDISSMVNSNVVVGEDIESDQDEDMNFKSKSIFKLSHSVAIEATESYPSVKSSPIHIYDSENNIVRHHINQQCVNILNEFIKTTAVSASKQLVESDQLLMKTQVSLQNSTTIIKKVMNNTIEVSEKLNDVLSCHFIPKLKIP